MEGYLYLNVCYALNAQVKHRIISIQGCYEMVFQMVFAFLVMMHDQRLKTRTYWYVAAHGVQALEWFQRLNSEDRIQ